MYISETKMVMDVCVALGSPPTSIYLYYHHVSELQDQTFFI